MIQELQEDIGISKLQHFLNSLHSELDPEDFNIYLLHDSTTPLFIYNNYIDVCINIINIHTHREYRIYIDHNLTLWYKYKKSEKRTVIKRAKDIWKHMYYTLEQL